MLLFWLGPAPRIFTKLIKIHVAPRRIYNRIFGNDHELRRDDFATDHRKDGEYKRDMSKSPEESKATVLKLTNSLVT